MKFKNFTKAIFLITIIFSWLIPTNNAEAVPAFARQMGVPCNGCHFQYFPKLNSFGRDFKIGGFTQGAQELIEDDGISLPPVLNASFYAALTYNKRELKTASTPEKKGRERGELLIPEDAAFFIGGRLGENMGTLTEFAGTGVESFKLVYSRDFGGVQGGVAAFSTETMGPAYGMEGWNTGAEMHIQPGVNMMQSSAQSIITSNAGAAVGITFFGSSDLFFVAAGLWGPVSVGTDTGLELSTYYRIALTPKLGEWDSMIGVVGTSGSTKCVECKGTGTTETEFKTNVTALNGQLQGDISGMSLGVYFDYVLETDTDAKNIYNAMGTKQQGFGLQADLGVTNTTGVRAAFMNKEWKMSGDKKLTATTLGFWHQIRQNVVLAVDYTTYGDDKIVMGTPVNSDLMAILKVGI
ncbi:MAG: hypothetical protein ACE5EN_06080 [Nitrospinota bacterium]